MNFCKKRFRGWMVVLLFSPGLMMSSCGSRSDGGQPADAEWISLFNGKDLSGWNKLEGQTDFRVENGEIVGTTIPNNPNSVLCTTDSSYSNFELELDIKVDSPLNSGVQIRSHLNDKGEVYGYQIEVDPSTRAWSGGIYDCRRRGWITPLTGQTEKQRAFKNGEWNNYRIRFDGDTLTSWVNGVYIATLIDTLTDPKGFIGLQADGNKQGGLEVRFRNLRLKKL